MESQVTCPLVDMKLVPGASQASRTPPFSQPSIFLRRIPCPPELRYKVEHVLEPLPATGAHRHRRLSPVSCSRRSTCRRRPVVQGGSATRSRSAGAPRSARRHHLGAQASCLSTTRGLTCDVASRLAQISSRSGVVHEGVLVVDVIAI